MIWEAGVKILEPKSCVRLVPSEPAKKKGFFQRLLDALFVIEEPEEAPAPLPASTPIPMVYGVVRAGGTVISPARLGPRDHSTFSTWRGEPMTPTQYYYEVAPHWWKAKGGTLPNVMADHHDQVLGQFDIEEWNDMEESERQDLIHDWMKINGLGALGIKAPEPDPQEAHARRMEKRAEADRLARQMQDHKRKLEEELKEAEARDQHYEGNAVFGAF